MKTSEIKAPIKSEPQALEMARQTLRRAKEMDLTPEEKEKVMAMIDQAKTEEKAGNKSKALNLYIQLKQYLDGIKQKVSGEVLDDSEIKRRQIALIDDTLANIKSQGIENHKKLYDAFELQKKTVMQASKLKTEIAPKDEINIIAKETLPEKQIWEEIKERAAVSDVFVYLNKKILDEDGNLLYLNLGIIGSPEIEWEYYLAGEFEYEKDHVGDNPKTIIGKSVNIKKILGQGSSAGIVATYNEQEHIWEPEI